MLRSRRRVVESRSGARLRRYVHIGKTGSANTQKSSSHIGVGIGIAIGIEHNISSEPDPDSDTDPECCATAGQIPPSHVFQISRAPGCAGLSIEKNQPCRLVIVVVVVIVIGRCSYFNGFRQRLRQSSRQRTTVRYACRSVIVSVVVSFVGRSVRVNGIRQRSRRS